jgi:hypothetical protein
VVAEGEALHLGVEVVADVEGDALGDALRGEALGVGEEPPGDGEEEDQGEEEEQGLDGGLGGGQSLGHGVDDGLNHLRHQELGPGGEEEEEVGQGGQAPVVPQVAYRSP